MSVVEGVRVALASLAANKLRSVLTMLGIIIGVAAVIALMAIGQGMQARIRDEIQRMGTNLITVFAGGQRSGSLGGGGAALTYEDAQALAGSPLVTRAAAVSPELGANYRLVAGSQNTSASVTGVVPDYLPAHNARIARGEFITAEHLADAANVVVLGPKLASTLFGGLDPVGQTVKINRLDFRVVGVLAAKGGGMFGSPDEGAYIPLTTMHRRLAGFRPAGATTTGHTVSAIAIQAKDEASVGRLMQEVTALLRERHRLDFGDENDFRIFNQADLLQSAAQISATVTLFLGAVAGISLLVGGIGIMNIMLVSVTERTREIGIRKAVGARGRDILAQFLIEAVTLSVAAGLAGILVGVGAAAAANGLGQRAVITPPTIALAAGVALAIGVFFGIYPARRASRLSPIEALRYE